MNNILHVYSPEFWHSPSIIIGDREGLLSLRRAVEQALKSDNIGHENYTVSDGEGADIYVVCQSAELMNHAVEPYTDEVTFGSNRNSKIHQETIVAEILKS